MVSNQITSRVLPIILAWCALLALPVPASAQRDTDEPPDGEPGAQIDPPFEQTEPGEMLPGEMLIDPSAGSSGVGSNTSDSALDGKLVLTASQEVEIVSASIGGRTEDLLWRVTVHAPLDRGTGRAVFADLNGLNDRASIEATLSYLHWKPTSDLDAQTAVCADYTIETYVCDPEHDSAAQVRDELIAARQALCKEQLPCTRDALTSDDARRQWDQAQAAICDRDKADIREHPRTRSRLCTRNILVREWRRYRGKPGLDDKAARLRALITRFDRSVSFNRTVLVSARVRAARATLGYADMATLDPRQDTVNMGGVGLSVGTVVSGLGSLIGSYEFQQFHDEGPVSEFCRPVVAGATQCSELALGAPERQRVHIARVELRRFFSPSFAAALRASYEFTDSVFAIELPLYFLKDIKGGLSGGLSLGYHSELDEPIVSVFISERLKLLE
jgi:hypothetical protein